MFLLFRGGLLTGFKAVRVVSWWGVGEGAVKDGVGCEVVRSAHRERRRGGTPSSVAPVACGALCTLCAMGDGRAEVLDKPTLTVCSTRFITALCVRGQPVPRHLVMNCSVLILAVQSGPEKNKYLNIHFCNPRELRGFLDNVEV